MEENFALYVFLTFIGVLFTVAVFSDGDSISNYKYKVTAPDFGFRYINHYTIDKNKCLVFRKKDKNYTWCGTYEICNLKEEN